jgi:hypothetical protein
MALELGPVLENHPISQTEQMYNSLKSSTERIKIEIWERGAGTHLLRAAAVQPLVRWHEKWVHAMKI